MKKFLISSGSPKGQIWTQLTRFDSERNIRQVLFFCFWQLQQKEQFQGTMSLLSLNLPVCVVKNIVSIWDDTAVFVMSFFHSIFFSGRIEGQVSRYVDVPCRWKGIAKKSNEDSSYDSTGEKWLQLLDFVLLNMLIVGTVMMDDNAKWSKVTWLIVCPITAVEGGADNNC